MDHPDDATFSGKNHVFLSIYLGLIVIALLAVTVGSRFVSQVDEKIADRKQDYVEVGLVMTHRAPESPSTSSSFSSPNIDPDAMSVKTGDRVEPGVASPVRAVTPGEQADTGLPRFDFDLADTMASPAVTRMPEGEIIKVQKQAFANGANLGTLSVSIDENARIFAQRDDLMAILQGNDAVLRRVARIETDGPVSFQRLREFGVNLRYDPIADRIILQDD